MKPLISFLSLIVLLASSCVKDHNSDPIDILDDVPEQLYYDNDIFDVDQKNIYGSWELISTSGGLAGSGYTPAFDRLDMKPNGIYGLAANDNLILFGKITLITDPTYNLLLQFTPDSNTPDNLLNSNIPDGWVMLQSDTLHIYGPCCDQYDTHFKRVQ